MVLISIIFNNFILYVDFSYFALIILGGELKLLFNFYNNKKIWKILRFFIRARRLKRFYNAFSGKKKKKR